MKKSNLFFNIIVSVVSLALVGTAVFISAVNSGSRQAITSSEPVDTNQPIATALPVDTNVAATKDLSSSRYRNGTYTTTASYQTPDGSEDMKVSLTLKNDIVTDSSVTMYTYFGDSHRYQNAFASNYKSYVVGKNIDSIRLSRVSGSSLTSGGFNDALAKIKSQAL